jgi:predicted nucleotidyltransferase
MPDRSVIQRVVDALRPYGPDRIYVFGSHARGEADELSDLDVVLIKQTSDPFFTRLRQAGQLLPADLAVDLLVYTPAEFERMLAAGNVLAETVVEEGRVVYERQPPG